MEDQAARQAVATYGLPVEDPDPHELLLGELARTAGHVRWLGELIAVLEHNVSGRARVGGTADDDDEDDSGGVGEGMPERASSGVSGLKQYTRDKGLLWEKPSVWIELYQSERQHLARVAKDCIQAGVEERRVRLAEDQARLLADVMRSFAADMGLDPAAEDVRTAMRRSLTVVAHGGEAA